MTQQQYIISRKTNILELGRILEISRRPAASSASAAPTTTISERPWRKKGLQGLLEKSRKAPRIGNRVAPEIEKQVFDYSLEFPTQGQVRASNELKLRGFHVSAGGIRSIWLRRLKRLEKWAAENLGILTEFQIQALEAAKEEAEVHG